MTRKQYTLLAEAWPQFRLPPWHRLRRRDRHRLKGLAVNELLGWRATRLLSVPEVGDAIQPIQPGHVLKASGHCEGCWLHNSTFFDFQQIIAEDLARINHAAKKP